MGDDRARLPIGVDTFSFHRLLGAPRRGEVVVAPMFASGGVPLLRALVPLECAVVSLQSCFLGSPSEADVDGLLEASGGSRLVVAWGHPEGIAFGRDSAALEDLVAWIPIAARLGGGLARILVGGPALRGREPVAAAIARSVDPLRRALDLAGEYGLALAIENHADLVATELAGLLEAVAHPGLGVCLDSGNALRVGDDPVAAAALLAPHVRMVHLKDVEPPDRAIDAVSGPCSVPFGTGVVPLEGVLAALAEPLARGAAVCVELGQIRPGDDEWELVADGLDWLRRR